MGILFLQGLSGALFGAVVFYLLGSLLTRCWIRIDYYQLLLFMAVYVARGVSHVRMANLQPFMPFGFHRTIATAGFVFVSYGGLIKISSVAEEVRDPVRVLPAP